MTPTRLIPVTRARNVDKQNYRHMRHSREHSLSCGFHWRQKISQAANMKKIQGYCDNYLWSFRTTGNNRTASMPFRKGQSGNPGGRPKILADVRELARAHTDTALNALVEIVENKKSPPAARVAAANSLLDRGYGKPEAKIDASISRQTVIRSPELCASTDEWRKKYGIE